MNTVLVPRKVYLPQCAGWYDFYTGNYIKPGQTIESPAPYERIPLYIKAGSIVPGRACHTAHRSPPPAPDDNTIRLFVYEGADAHFDLYEDDGVSYDYEPSPLFGDTPSLTANRQKH